ncbi:MAG TPA: c-type cytochrome [Pseudolabrys sp.]|jgi:mono/diheme cytochrome c family protein|nr:c-type cytochrome [Pseudolabrys sp.]
MNKTIISILRVGTGFCCLILVFAASENALAADARHGETLAKRWCAACHVVSADQKSGNTQAPPFSAIARKPGFDGANIATFLQTSHPRMPDMNLTRGEAADLAAYIKSQR